MADKKTAIVEEARYIARLYEAQLTPERIARIEEVLGKVWDAGAKAGPGRTRLLAASCDEHLAEMISGTLPGPYAPPADVRVRELVKPRPELECRCGKFARWEVRTR